nr:hypothetical protein [uncultured Devosia sp.]
MSKLSGMRGVFSLLRFFILAVESFIYTPELFGQFLPFRRYALLASFQRVSGLINRSSPSSAVGSKSFLRKEFQGLKVDLNLEARGQKSGARGLPSTADTALDAVEADIINTVLSVQQRAFSQLEKAVSDLQQAVDFLDLEGRLARIRVAAAAGLPDLAGELQFKIDGLQQLRREATEAEGWHRKFRAHNHLDRPSKVISSTSLVLLWLVVVACIAMATFVNVALLDKQGAVGWFDGWMGGPVLAILNIGMALLFALYGVPAFWHRSLPKRLIGIASILTYLALTVLLNLALAHYREVPGGLAQGAGETILQRLLQTPFMLDDPYSWFLAGLGVILSLVALMAVLGMRDLYPGYAQAAEISRAARVRHEASRARLVDERPVSNSHASTLDSLAIPALWGEEPASRLMPADNAGLGLARAIGPAPRLRWLDLQFPYSAKRGPVSRASLMLEWCDRAEMSGRI